MFVDASAIVALLAEPENPPLARCLEMADAPITSALAVFEAVSAVARKKTLRLEDAENAVLSFLTDARIALVPLAISEAHLALQAYARFGKGQGHPARLNMGDCFAYACARVHDVPLLFVGDDFPQTDIRSAGG